MASLKTLRVCLSSDLPIEADRDPEYIYFVYNTLRIYLGKALFGEDYSIVESMPNEPLRDMMYICLNDGMAKIYDEYGIHEIAEVETPEMINVLRQAGTMFYFNAKERYIDTQTRTLVLPFENGTYQLAIDTPDDLLYNENTIIKYNPDSDRFEIYGETLDDDPLDTRGFRGHETDTINLNVSDGVIKADLKISDKYDNAIKVAEDGIYAVIRNKVTNAEFNSFKSYYDDYKTKIDLYLKSISENITDLQDLISEEDINRKIQESLEEVYPGIGSAIAAYDGLADRLAAAILEARRYTNSKVSSARASIEQLIKELSIDPWGGVNDKTSDAPDENVYAINGEETTIEEATMGKTGDTRSLTDANNSGSNAIIKVTQNGTLNIINSSGESDGLGAHALYADNNSTINITNCNFHTKGDHSDAIRVNGGSVIADGQIFATYGTASRLIYAIGDVIIDKIVATAAKSEAVVVDGNSSVTISGSDISSAHVELENSSDKYTAFALIKSDLPATTAGTAELSLANSSISLINAEQYLFTVKNTNAIITVNNCEISKDDSNERLLDMSSSQNISCTLNMVGQKLHGDIVGDNKSAVTVNLRNKSELRGSINKYTTTRGAEVHLYDTSVWVLTANSYIDSLTLEATSGIVLDGYTLYVAGTPYTPS